MDPSRSASRESSPYSRMKTRMANAMQPGDSKSTTGRLPPDERESILPMREDESPLYGKSQSTEGNNAGAGKREKGRDRGMMQAAGETVSKALGRK